jgi:hypothetical protein
MLCISDTNLHNARTEKKLKQPTPYLMSRATGCQRAISPLIDNFLQFVAIFADPSRVAHVCASAPLRFLLDQEPTLSSSHSHPAGYAGRATGAVRVPEWSLLDHQPA